MEGLDAHPIFSYMHEFFYILLLVTLKSHILLTYPHVSIMLILNSNYIAINQLFSPYMSNVILFKWLPTIHQLYYICISWAYLFL